MSAKGPGAAEVAPGPGARHPLTLRERAWLAGQLRTVRGRGLRPGDQVAIDTAALAVAGVVLGEGDRIAEVGGIDQRSPGSWPRWCSAFRRPGRPRARGPTAPRRPAVRSS